MCDMLADTQQTACSFSLSTTYPDLRIVDSWERSSSRFPRKADRWMMKFSMILWIETDRWMKDPSSTRYLPYMKLNITFKHWDSMNSGIDIDTAIRDRSEDLNSWLSNSE